MQYCFLIIFLIFFSVVKAAENGKKVNLPDLKDAKDLVKPISHVLWTNQTLPSGGKAFRDTLMEKVVQRFFENFVSKIKDQSLAGPQILQDPMPIKKGIDVEKKGSAYQIHLQADGIKAHGLGDLKINYLRATRRFGLKNLRVNITISTDLRLDGRYKLKGKALSFIPVEGDGVFVIKIKTLKFYAHTFLSYNDKAGAGGEKEDQLLLKDLDMEVRYNDLDFEFKNLMGGGVVGSTINVIINVLGEEIVKTQKHQIIDALRNGFHSVLTQFL